MKLTFIPYMPVVCCQCSQVTGWVATIPERAHMLSHGYCLPCANKIKSQIKKP